MGVSAANSRAGDGTRVGTAAARGDGQVDEEAGETTEGADGSAGRGPDHTRAYARRHRQTTPETQDLQTTDRRRGRYRPCRRPRLFDVHLNTKCIQL